MKVWHYAINGIQAGPVATDELADLIRQGTLTPESLVWKEGMAEWAVISSLPHFAALESASEPASSSPYEPPGVEANEAIQWDDFVPSGSQVRPWIRFWARGFDMFIFAVVLGIIAAFVYPAYEEMSDYLVGILHAALMIPVEAMMLSTFGNTPGKALLNMRIRNRNGTRLDFRQALLRSIRVWIRGSGLGLPLISLITYYTSYKNLSEQGIVSWDREGGHLPRHRVISWWRILVIVMAIVGFILAMVYVQEQGIQ